MGLGALDLIGQCCCAVVGIIGFTPLIIISLIANPIIVARNWDNPCDDFSPFSLCAWLTASSVVTLTLSGIGIASAFIVDSAHYNDKVVKRVRTVLIVQGVALFCFLIAWASVGGWLIFGNGPASACAGQELGQLTVANFACQIVAICLGWTLFKTVLDVTK